MIKIHSFHIPVMGIGFTIDTPLKVSQYGIDSVISLVDDVLLEKLRKMYSEKYKLPYSPIPDSAEDCRAKRITSYLNLINLLAKIKFNEFKNSLIEKTDAIKDYFDMLPDYSILKQKFKSLSLKHADIKDFSQWIKNNLSMGSIDVNIMTKVDKENYRNGEKLPVEYNDAHAALRGYANSNLKSSLILSAGMNPRLYGYIAKFENFYPNENGEIEKKIVLKVSDYRSAFIQGKFLAKKGLWVSEYRIESGLNCGGHAFASDGFLLGPILAEFRDNKETLIKSNYDLLMNALKDANRILPKDKLPFKITAQGGVGTSEEHQFLLEYYKLDSIGWGTPFLLVPEVTNVDEHTINLLSKAKEKDLYLSKISPLGVPFNSLKGNTKDIEKTMLVNKGRPGSSCPKKFLVSNTEFTNEPICSASRQYQNFKLKELNSMKLTDDEYKKRFDKIVEKSCLCVGLGTTPLIKNDLDRKIEGNSVSICPGPNMAYFSEIVSLKKMIDHIYGRTNIIKRDDRPNIFINELRLYIGFLQDKIEEAKDSATQKQEKYLSTFANNLNDGIIYYQNLFDELKDKFESTKSKIIMDLAACKNSLQQLMLEIENLSMPKITAM